MTCAGYVRDMTSHDPPKTQKKNKKGTMGGSVHRLRPSRKRWVPDALALARAAGLPLPPFRCSWRCRAFDRNHSVGQTECACPYVLGPLGVAFDILPNVPILRTAHTIDMGIPLASTRCRKLAQRAQDF